jgi:sulfite exporter TauE/SafE
MRKIPNKKYLKRMGVVNFLTMDQIKYPINVFLKYRNLKPTCVFLFCVGRLYAMQTGMKIDSKTPECRKFLSKLMDQLEAVSYTLLTYYLAVLYGILFCMFVHVFSVISVLPLTTLSNVTLYLEKNE